MPAELKNTKTKSRRKTFKTDVKYAVDWSSVFPKDVVEKLHSHKMKETDVYELAGVYIQNEQQALNILDSYTKDDRDKIPFNTPGAKTSQNEAFKITIQPLIMKESSGEPCPVCLSTATFLAREQLRSGDEGETAVSYCQSCSHKWF
jgi:DNA-directed RNA polymerase subunit M/transcription elongation factor TFIIS